MVYSHNGMLPNNEKGPSAVTLNIMNESQKRNIQKKADTKEIVLEASTYVKCKKRQS